VKTQSVSVRLLAMVVLSLALSMASVPLLKASLEVAIPGSPWLQKLVRYEEEEHRVEGHAGDARYTYDLGRVSRRYLALVALVIFVSLRRWVPWSALARKGFRRSDIGPQLGFGIAAGVVMVGVYSVILVASGTVSWAGPTAGYLARRSVDFAIGAVLIALLEEYFFRGVFFRSMVRDWGVRAAIVGSGTVFAALHCISGGLRVAPGWDPMIGATLFKMYFTSDGSPLPDLRLMVGLFLFAWLLAYLYLRTGALWVPVGLHGGMVFASKIMKKTLNRSPDFPEWLLGDSLFLVSGVACWVLLLITLAVMTRVAPRGPLYRRIQKRSY
jgi:membrane protease YdiL (CAAX protease family)